MATPPKPTQFEGDRGRVIPELEQTGPNDTISVGEAGASRDDLVPRYKKTMGDFLKSVQTDQLGGNKRDETTPFADSTTLVEHDRGKFFNRSIDVDIRNEIQSITTDLTAEEILRAIQGSPNAQTAIYHEDSTPDNSQNVRREISAGSSRGARNVIAATNTVLSNNRFSPTNPYMINGGSARTPQFAAVPAGLGVYKRESTEHETMTLDQLKRIGSSLMLRATGEIVQGDPLSPGTSFGSLLPGRAQLGIPIDARDLYAKEAFGAPGRNRSLIPNVSTESDERGDLFGSTPSYGQLNSMNEPFAGFLPIGMVALSILLVVAISALILGFAALFSIPSALPKGEFVTGNSPAQMVKGSYKQFKKKGATDLKPPSFISFRDIGIVELDRPFALAVRAGIQTFFDLETGLGARASFKRITQSPGFYVNMMRTIIRSTAKLIEAVVEAFKAVATNPVAGLQQILGIFDILKSSKIIAFMNIMAVIGDTKLSIDERKNKIETVLSPYHSKSRISDDERKLTWNLTAAPASLILPKSIETLKTTMGKGGEYTETHKALKGIEFEGDFKGEANTTRFSPEFVKAMEDKLEAEYVPFYFQDLRTNEIVSFHAFIDQVTEQFAPNYNSTNPFGRVDPVMSYTNTTRTFNLAFKVVATNAQDLAAMYVKLNKFTTLVYPQWTAGRQVEDKDGNKFRQPFSQVQAASPLVRIRLGDLIKTNFSNPALARLFGASEEGAFDLKFSDSRANSEKGNADILSRPLVEARYVGSITAEVIAQFIKSEPTAALPAPPPLGPTAEDNARLLISKWVDKGSLVQVLTPNPLDPKIVTCKLVGSEFATWLPIDLLIEDLVPTAKGLDWYYGLGPPGLSPTKFNEFFDFEKGEKNPIVRSFKNTSGRGLAGFITSLSIEWQEAITAGKWNIDRGQSAPMMCKLTTAFTVIHDIQPGIDVDGFNRAPLYDIRGANPYK